MVAAVVSMILGTLEYHEKGEGHEERGLFEGLAILFCVAIVTFVTAINDWQKEKQFRKLQEAQDQQNTYTVTRHGNSIQLDRSEICVGDVVHIKMGDQICADGVVVESNQIEVDEAAMTGEIDMMHKVTLEQAQSEL